MRHAVCLALGLLLPATAAAQSDSPPSAAAASAAATVQPEAIAALERMGTYLRGLKNFTVHGDTTIDLVMEDGQKLEFPGTVDYKVRAPNGLQLDIKSDRKERQLFYDGKTLTVYGPKNKLYASTDAPPTIGALLDAASNKYGIELPLADLFLWGTDKAPTAALQSAVFVGPARVAGTPTEHYAFRQEGVDWQVWIEPGAKPLELELDDLAELLARERLELDDLVHPVQELGAEVLAERLGRADVGGHDDHRVAEVDRAALAVGQAPVVEDLQEHVEDLGVRLLDLVEEDDGVRPAADGLGELAALLVADVAGRRADEAGDRVPLLVLGHVQADEGALVVEHELGERAGKLGLPHAGRAEEDE